MCKTVVTIGTFDGVHRGHQSVLLATREAARRLGWVSVAFTFDAPPRSYGNQEEVGLLLLPPPLKLNCLRRFVDRVVEASFPVVRDLDATEFVDSILLEELNAGSIVVGESFRFGRGRAGDPLFLEGIAARVGIEVQVIPPLWIAGAAVSSTRIRSSLRSGDVGLAEKLLGRPPVLAGTVREGNGIGRTLGFPTANLDIDPRILRPASGVYLGYARGADSDGHALVYIGTRPTVAGTDWRCEVHLLAAPRRELRGASMQVDLVRRIREDRRFATLEALRLQMEIDANLARGLATGSLEDRGLPPG